MSRVRRMPLPALVAVDEDRQVLEAVEAQLAGRYAGDYRIECLRDPAEALQTLAELRGTSVEVALVLVGQSLEASARDALLRREGFRVIRIAARDVLKEMDAVLRYIVATCSEVGPLHHSAPLNGSPPRSGEDLS